MNQPYWHADPYPHPPRTGLGLGAGAALGALVGLLGPILLALLMWGASSVLSQEAANSINGLLLTAILGLPVLLLVGGCLLMIPDQVRGWGVAALTASGVWLISSAGVCTVAFFTAMSSYENHHSLGLL